MSRLRNLAGLGLCAAALSIGARGPEEKIDEIDKTPALPEADRIRLAEAFRLASAVGDSVWPGWSRVPFAVVLVTPETEYFVRHPRPPAGTQPLGNDALLGSPVFARPRTFPTGFLATFPVEGVSTVVVGQPEKTGLSSPTEWVVTLLHEHFHQLQDSQPGFYDDVRALGLARGDETGMWMLEFPFPYASPSVAESYARAARALRSALAGADPAPFRPARAAFRAALSEDDRKYFDFQIWKEGVARYTQLKVAERAAAGFEPSADFRALPGFETYGAVVRALSDGIARELTEQTLPEAKRLVVYPFGAAEALLLDRTAPCWKSRYFATKFTLSPGFEAPDCGGGSAGRG